jgi:hypothetical protein
MEVERLDEEVESSRRHRFGDGWEIVVGGHQDDVGADVSFASQLQQFESSNAGHTKVNNRYVDVLHRQRRKRRLAARGREDARSIIGEGARQRGTHARVVVYDENASSVHALEGTRLQRESDRGQTPNGETLLSPVNPRQNRAAPPVWRNRYCSTFDA